MICIAQRDMIEKYTQAPMSSGKPQRRTCVVRRHVCPGVPGTSKELDPGGTWMLSSHFKDPQRRSKSWAVYQDSTNSTFNGQVLPVW